MEDQRSVDSPKALTAPFPYFGGKRKIASLVWARLGEPKQYIEPFCGSAAMLLSAPRSAPLEVIGDANGFIANFWRATKAQFEAVAHHADYPVSHVDLGARHQWLLERREHLAEYLADPEWPGDAQAAGWWLWGQCAWIGAGWAEWSRTRPLKQGAGRIPQISRGGQGVHAIGKIQHIGNGGLGVQDMMTSAGAAALVALRRLAARLDRVRIIHGEWSRGMNHYYGKEKTAVFLDPPYKGYEKPYSVGGEGVAAEVEEWAREHPRLRIALCGHAGDYDLPGWEQVAWTRAGGTFGSSKARASEMLWFSPGCARR